MTRTAACLLVLLLAGSQVGAAGPTPERRGMFSHDKQCKTLVLRQFHVEVFELAPPGQPWRVYSRTRPRCVSR